MKTCWAVLPMRYARSAALNLATTTTREVTPLRRRSRSTERTGWPGGDRFSTQKDSGNLTRECYSAELSRAGGSPDRTACYCELLAPVAGGSCICDFGINVAFRDCRRRCGLAQRPRSGEPGTG